MKRIISIVILFVIICCFYSLYDGMCDDIDATTKATKKVSSKGQDADLIYIDNKICPVLNRKISEEFKVQYTYKGKVYNFCCKSCINKFKKKPQKYIKKLR